MWVDRSTMGVESGPGADAPVRTSDAVDDIPRSEAVVTARKCGDGLRANALGRLTQRERQVLALMAQGLSNAGIAERLVVSGGAVEKHIANVFMKLDLEPTQGSHRRVVAVLRYLHDAANGAQSWGG
jgi:DNA-binding NarL/FixJ family response regulator